MRLESQFMLYRYLIAFQQDKQFVECSECSEYANEIIKIPLLNENFEVHWMDAIRSKFSTHFVFSSSIRNIPYLNSHLLNFEPFQNFESATHARIEMGQTD